MATLKDFNETLARWQKNQVDGAAVCKTLDSFASNQEYKKMGQWLKKAFRAVKLCKGRTYTPYTWEEFKKNRTAEEQKFVSHLIQLLKKIEKSIDRLRQLPTDSFYTDNKEFNTAELLAVVSPFSEQKFHSETPIFASYQLKPDVPKNTEYERRHDLAYDLTYGWLKPEEIFADPEEARRARQVVEEFRKIVDAIWDQLSIHDRLPEGTIIVHEYVLTEGIFDFMKKAVGGGEDELMAPPREVTQAVAKAITDKIRHYGHEVEITERSNNVFDLTIDSDFSVTVYHVDYFDPSGEEQHTSFSVGPEGSGFHNQPDIPYKILRMEGKLVTVVRERNLDNVVDIIIDMMNDRV